MHVRACIYVLRACVRVRVRIYVCICMYVCIYVRRFVLVCLFIYTFTSVYVLFIHRPPYVRAHACTHVHMYV